MKHKINTVLLTAFIAAAVLILYAGSVSATEADGEDDVRLHVRVTFTAESDTASFPMLIDMYFKNAEGEQFFVECSSTYGCTITVPLPVGSYSLSGYEIFSHNAAANELTPVDYIVEVEPFTVKPEDGAGGASKQVTVTATDRNVYMALHGIQQADTEATGGHGHGLVHAGNTQQNVANPYASTDQREIAYYTIPEDDEYFPGWTILEIQEWYKQEVEAFLETDFCTSGAIDNKITNHRFVTSGALGTYPKGLTLTDPEYYYATVDFFTSEVSLKLDTSGKHSKGNLYWSIVVDEFHPERTKSEETMRFYETLDKIFCFIEDYYLTYGIQLNFSVWDYDLPTIPAASSEAPGSPETVVPAPADVPDGDMAGETEAAEGPAEEIDGGKEPEKEPEGEGGGKGAAGVIGAAAGVILLALAGTGIYLFKKKDRD